MDAGSSATAHVNGHTEHFDDLKIGAPSELTRSDTDGPGTSAFNCSKHIPLYKSEIVWDIPPLMKCPET